MSAYRFVFPYMLESSLTAEIESRLQRLEEKGDQTQQTLTSMDRSLQRLVVIQERHDKVAEKVDAIDLTVSRHDERLDSHRWILRLLIVSTVGALGSVLAILVKTLS